MAEADSNFISGSWMLFVFGIVLIIVSYAVPWPTISKGLLTLGVPLLGFLPLQPFRSLRYKMKVFKDCWKEKSIYSPFNCSKKIKEVNRKKKLPIFIVVDIEGCITPPDRTEIDLQKFQRLRCYCEYVRKSNERKFPPLVICTGRSQGYVELLAQSLGMVDGGNMDLPFVIENGSALYYPVSKKTTLLLTSNQMELIQKVQRVLTDKLCENEFEPKAYMITINPIINSTTSEKIDMLRRKVESIITNKDTIDTEFDGADVSEELAIETTDSAVDITPNGINKISGLEETLKIYHNLCPEDIGKGFGQHVVAIVDSTSDLCIIEKVGDGNAGGVYCSNEDANKEVKKHIAEKFSNENIMESRQIDLIMEVIERETGLGLT
ncbi:MAG: HAD hydrolase family protein [Euryarchaeota archaeon]|nr:HAD hydrolase family protein [Euryarchaeota archaeon]